MEQLFTRKHYLLSLLAFCWLIFGSPVSSYGLGGSVYYQPNGATFSGTNTYCQNQTPANLCANYTTCTSGGGTVAPVNGNLQWYYMTPAQNTAWVAAGSNCANAPTFATAHGAPMAVVTNSATGSVCTTPNTSLAPGVYRYFAAYSFVTTTAGACTGNNVWCSYNITINARTLSPIVGTTTLCGGGATTTLSHPAAGGTWSSSNVAVASIGSGTGLVTTGTAGTTTIVYQGGTCALTSSVVVTVRPLPNAMTGVTLCSGGSSVTMSNSVTGGTWTSSNPAVASVVLNTGVVTTGVLAAGATGTTTITYQTACASRTAVITVNAPPAPIVGTTPICSGGATTTLSSSSNGTWTSGTPAIASINSGTGLVTTGPTGGTTIITYSNGCGPNASMTFSVTAPIAAITGNTVICTGGATTTLSNTTPGGTWTSSTPAVASINVNTGVVTSGVVAAGTSATTTISYSNGCGIPVTATVLVLGTPGPISGTPAVCQGFTTTLSAGVNGTWSSGNVAVATATGTNVGTITGVSGGASNSTAVISYSNGCAPASVITVTVTGTPGPITGGPNVCDNGSITLSSAVTGGTWMSTATGNATVTLGPVGGGVVFGVPGQGGTHAGILYSNGCGVQTTTVTVLGVPTLITGPAYVCSGSNITLSNNGVPTGTWTSSNPASVSINSTTGVITGGVNGGAVITAANSCGSTTFSVTASTPATITGNLTFCQNSTTTLSNSVSGGVWSSSNPLLGTTTGVVNDGTVYGVPLGGTGCFNITYTLPSGCYTTTVLCTTVSPSPINGVFAMCQGNSVDLTDATPGGTWSASNTNITVNSVGHVTGGTAGTATVTYSVGACPSTALITVNPLPAAIGGPSAVCQLASITMTNTTPFGGWSINNGNATIDPAGVVTGVNPGTSVVTYTLPTGCYITRSVTINPVPAAIAGNSSVCVGQTLQLSDATPLGVWSSSNNIIAPVSGSGLVTGNNPGGVANITYTLPTSCYAVKAVTVNTLPGPIVGPTAMCTGTTATLTSSPAGGNWTSTNLFVATIGAAAGDVNASNPGNTGIIYTLGTGCTSTFTITVNQTPSLISGMDSVCVGLTTTLSNTVSGGAWTSVNTGVATVTPSTGIVTGVSGLGTSEIIYARLGCAVSRTVTVNPLPSPITGPTVVCVGSTITLNSSPAGGTWFSTNPAVAPIDINLGTITGTAPGGNATITYTLPTTCITTQTVTVFPLPASITGANHLCAGQSTTLSSSPNTGTWSSSNTTVATILPTGVITAGANPGGTTTINYVLPSGCSAQFAFTVNPIPAPILGANAVCSGLSVSLTDITSGGVWSSSNPSTASVTPGPGITGGVVTGGVVPISTATVITYSLSTGCTATKTFTVNPLPTVITGNRVICAGLTTQLSNGTPFGTWSSSNPTIASINTFTGFVTGGATPGGNVTITYTLGTGCIMTTTLQVNPLPDDITGNLRICAGNTSQLSDATGTGTWSSQLVTVASVDVNTGLVTGGNVPLPGPLTSRITYTLASTGCIAVATMTVSALPLPITGPNSVCQGSSITVSDATGGGVWSSSNPALATISFVGPTVFVNATAVGGPTGLDTIMYTISSGCMQTKTVSVTLQPDPITGGPLDLCQGSVGNLADATPGGVWSTSNSAVATVVGGVVTAGTVVGTANISYSLGSCVSIAIVNVKVQPGPISGVKTMCYGSGTTLSNATPLGIWTSDDPTVAIIGGGGNVTSGGIGMTTGTANITYNVAGCTAMTTVSVTPQPTVITGTTSFCNLSSVTLSNSVSGGVWSSNTTTIASVDPTTGVVTGTAAMPMSANGSALISYTMPGTGCFAVRSVTVKIQPMPLTGNKVICLGSSTQLSSNPGTGVWSASLTSQTYISVGSTGIVTGVAASVGTGDFPIVDYTINGCSTSETVTVNPLPSQITGIFYLCLGSSTTLADLTPGGTWSSSNPAVANIGIVNGIANGTGLGTTNITYTLPTGCIATHTLQVIPVPGAITGSSSVCQGFTTPLSSNTFGGLWTSSNTNIATIDPASGVLTGVDAGTVITSYTLGSGCRVIAPMVVYPLQPITGNTTICSGQSTFLSDVTVGGTWTTSNVAVASITSTGIVTGGTPGTAIIGWNLPSGCVATTTITVQSLPAPITGITTICDYQTTVLSNSLSGGVWSSANPIVANINSLTGDVTTGSGVTTPTDVVISYTMGCAQTTTLTINPVPAPIVGNTNMCLGYTQLFTDATPLGTWSSTNSLTVSIDANTGLASADGLGTESIIYTLPTGCSASVIVVVNPLPGAITGPSNVCVGSSVQLSSTSTGGAWFSSNPVVADVVFATGVVTGMNVGTAVISYQVATGCFTTFTITVDPLPAPITGPSQVCVGSTISLNSVTAGGVWTSSAPAFAVVNSTGDVTGLNTGVTDISYTLSTTGCAAVHTVSVSPLPAPITGSFKLCKGMTTQLADADAGGVWTSSNTFVGTVDPSTGLVHSDANPPTSIFNIIYTLPTGCAAVQTMTVVNAPSPISGAGQVCVGSCTPLSDTTVGGIWSSFDVTVATVDPATGVVCGVSAGFSVITYTMGGGACYETHIIIVNPLPAPITGITEVCAGLTTQLSDATPGGVWTSQSPAIASVGAFTGTVTGVTAGTTTISYTLPTQCYVTTSLVVNPLPAPITGNTNICLGGTRTLSDSPGPGMWSVANPAVATIDPISGVITGVDYNVPPGAPYGMTTVTYTINATGCIQTTTVAVHPLPQVFTVTGGGSYCSGTGGVRVGLSGSEIGVSYYLYLGTSTPTGPYAGTGLPLDFGLQVSGGVYTIVANNTYTTCSSNMTGSATITVIPSVVPTVDIIPNPDDTVCSGTSVTFIPNSTNAGTSPVYSWSVNGIHLSNAPSYTFVPANGDVVSVVLNSNAICAIPATAKDTLTMTVYTSATPAVSILVSPNDTVCSGSPVTFTAVPSNGGSAPTYQWTVNSNPVSTAPVYTYVPSNGDLVFVTMTSNAPCRLSTAVQSSTQVIRVVDPVIPSIVITASNGSLITAGQSDTLTANVTNGVAPTFQWFLNGVPVNGATGPDFIIDNAHYGDSIGVMVYNHGFCNEQSFSWMYIQVHPVSVNPVVGVSSDIAVIPNPNNGVFTVKGTLGSTTSEDVSLELTNMLGQVVYKGTAKAPNGKLNTTIKLDNNVANGMYMLNVRTDNEHKVFHLVVEQ